MSGRGLQVARVVAHGSFLNANVPTMSAIAEETTPPEQAEHTKLADARSDIYSLGMSLWFLLTGRPTYERDSLASKIVAHRTAPIPCHSAFQHGGCNAFAIPLARHLYCRFAGCRGSLLECDGPD